MNREELKNSVLKQIEYYFSDENLIRGKYLNQLIKKSGDGWIHLNVLVSFKRLARLTTDVKLIGKLLCQSNSKVIELSKDKQRVRRIYNKQPPKKNHENVSEMISRSAYIEGFSKDLDIDFLVNFFSQSTNLIIRKYYDKTSGTYKSKGSAFITFATIAKCNEFLSQKIMLNGEQLTVMHQEEFIKNKKMKKK